MNRRIAALGILAAALMCAAAALAQKTTAEGLFREALMKERAEGNLSEAIFKYERLIVEFPKDRQFAAQALFQLAQAYEKLGDPRAKLMLTRLTRDYANVEPYATRARTKLQALQTSGTAPFPEVALDKDIELGSPDGKLAVYHKSPQDWGRVYVKELATGKERLLIDHVGKSVSNLAWSPDSVQLAYTLQDNEAKVFDIRTIQVASRETTSLGLRGYPIDWTDTGEIFFYRANYSAVGADYFLVPAKGGTARKVHFSPTFGSAITPDATRLLITKSKKLYVLNLATGEEQPLTIGTGEETRALVSADSRLVAFAANPEGKWGFYVAPLDRGFPVKQPLRITDLSQPAVPVGGGLWASRQWWTRDGLLTFGMQDSETNLYRVDLDPATGRALGAPRRLTQDARSNWLPAVSPDGKHIAYWYRNGSRIGLAVMDSDGANERPLLEQNLVLWLSWRSPEEILFKNGKPKEGEKPSIYALNINSGALLPVAQVEGNYWFYVAARKEILHLYPGGGGARPGAVLKAFSLAEGKDRVVAQIDHLMHIVAPSPDGKRIAYSTSRPIEGSNQRLWEVSVMSITGEPEGTLIPAQQDLAVATCWSPDGKYLLYGTGNGPRILNVQTKESWPLHSDANDTIWARGASWSPDGSFVLVHKGATSNERLSWKDVTAEAVARLMQK